MAQLLGIGAAVGGGLLVAVQAAFNNRLRQGLGDVLAVTAVSFAIGTLCLLAVLVLRGQFTASLRGLAAAWPQLPWWALAGGLCGAGYVAGLLVGVSHVGMALAIAGVLIGQSVGAAVLDACGAFGLVRVPFGAERCIGLILLLAGAWLMRAR